ncbi:hypothetical protein [Massilia sp. LjRoot122]|uniref:hypothetical protein n=1 Tax=Massilia sp. LjRoot122 TaxID=3342257 RepID=UPI003ED0C700
MTKKLETRIHRANGGNHSPVNYRKHKNMLLTHPYAIGLLFHIVLTGSEDRATYRKAVELLCKQLRAKGMPCRYKACYERDKWKRFHKHIFLLIEAKDTHPNSIIHYSTTGWFTKMLKGMGLGFNICSPEDIMHYVGGKKVNYAYVPKKAGSKLEDCCEWISYLTKVRSKAGVEGQIYTGSTNREPKQTLPPSAALPAAVEEVITQTELKESNETSIATQYEAGSGSESIAASGSTEASRSAASTSSTAMVGTGCESMEASASSASRKEAKDQRRCRTGGTGTDYEEVNLAELVGPVPFFPYQLPVRTGKQPTSLGRRSGRNANQDIEHILVVEAEEPAIASGFHRNVSIQELSFMPYAASRGILHNVIGVFCPEDCVERKLSIHG